MWILYYDFSRDWHVTPRVCRPCPRTSTRQEDLLRRDLFRLKSCVKSVEVTFSSQTQAALSYQLTNQYRVRRNTYTSNSWQLFDMYVFVLSSNLLTKVILAYMCVYLFWENSWERGELRVSNSNLMVLRIVHVCMCIEFLLQMLNKRMHM